MRKILITTAAALAASIAVAASTVPANAGGVNVTIGLGGWGNSGWYPGYGSGIYLGGPFIQSTWDLHVDWCFDHKGPSYNPNTNKYINQNGKIRTCHSPYA